MRDNNRSLKSSFASQTPPSHRRRPNRRTAGKKLDSFALVCFPPDAARQNAEELSQSGDPLPPGAPIGHSLGGR